jgi:mannose-6-phosphate isomerase-like protein (cupin superfamily)
MIESDEVVSVAARLEEFWFTALWAMEVPVVDAASGWPVTESHPAFIGPPGSIRVVSAGLAPRTVFDRPLDKMAGEANRELPGLLESMSAEKGVGMHRTPTVDIWCVVSGQAVLVTETGSTELGAGDWFVQQATWHRWENRLDEPCEVVGLKVTLSA